MGHVMIRRIRVAILAIAVTVAGVRAFPQQGSASSPAGSVELNTVLDMWVENSSRIKTLSATFGRKNSRPFVGSMDLTYEINWKDSGQAVVTIELPTRKDRSEFVERIVWTGREVWQYNPRRKEITVWTKDELGSYELFRQSIQNSGWGWFVGNQFDFIFPALSNPKDIDPLPFLVGMKETVAKKRFKFELLENSDANGLVVRATPLDPTLNTTYDHILVTLDRERHLPVVVEYQKGWRGKDSRRYTLVAIKLDRQIDDASFVPQKPKGWTIKSR